jgi:hypothetical protein
MGSEDERAPSDIGDTLLSGIRLRLRALEGALRSLRNEKADLEGELSECKQKVGELTKELLALRHQLQRVGSGTKVIASKNRHKFHRLTCEYATGIRRSTQALYYEDREAAIAAGYKPCNTCCS